MTARRLLAIEVGNSRIKAGLFDAAPIADPLPTCHAATAWPVAESKPVESIAHWLASERSAVEIALLSGVNPSVIATIETAWRSDLGELKRLARPSNELLVNRTDQPERVGSDRLFDAVAANRLRPPGVAAVVIDAGTATTVNLVDGNGVFRGGAIFAGFELVSSALHERTALLPKITSTDLVDPPDPLGRNTEAALLSGLYWGLVGGVKELVSRFSKDESDAARQQPIVVLTGGASPLLAPHLPMTRLEPRLTLQGMVISSLCDAAANERETRTLS